MNDTIVYVTNWIKTRDGYMKLYGRLRSSLAAWADQHGVDFYFTTEEKLEAEIAEHKTRGDFYSRYNIHREFLSIGC